MTTSLRQLLDQARTRAEHMDPGPAAVTDAADALCHIARAVDQLAADAMDRVAERTRGAPAAALAAACRHAGGTHPAGGGPLGDLTGAAADVTCLWSPTLTRDERWAAAAEFGRLAEACARLIGRERPYSQLPPAVHAPAAALQQAAGADPPPPAALTVLDRPAASDKQERHLLQLAAQAMLHIDAVLHTEPATRLSVVEWHFAAATAETATRYTVALLNPSPPPEPPPWRGAAAWWRQARDAAAPFIDDVLHRRDRPPPIIRWAEAAQQAMAAEFGPLTVLERRPPEPLTGWTALQLQHIASTLPTIAARLNVAAGQWAEEGLVRADARDVVRDRDDHDRITDALHGRIVTVDHQDIHPIHAALVHARSRCRHLANAVSDSAADLGVSRMRPPLADRPQADPDHSRWVHRPHQGPSAPSAAPER